MGSYIDSKTPVGPARWRRAAENYDRAPDSWAGQLFSGRVTQANELVQANDGEIGPWRFDRNDARNWGIAREHWKAEWRPRYYTCSLFCTLMQAQLAFSSEEDLTLFELVLRETTNWHGRVTKASPVKSARCQACGRTIHADGQVDGDPQVDWPDWALAHDPSLAHDRWLEGGEASTTAEEATGGLVFVDRIGNVIDDIEEIRAVQLSPREATLFFSADAEHRRLFATTYGRTLEDHFG